MRDGGSSADRAEAEAPVSRRELAVRRSLVPVRAEAEKRVQEFLDSAIEVMSRSPGTEPTLKTVVEHSGRSLRTFYHHFDGKHQLLLAVFEESMRVTADQLREEVVLEGAPLLRLRAFVIGYHRRCRPTKVGPAGVAAQSVMVEFAHQLLLARPAEASRAFAPLVSLFSELVDQARSVGAVRPGPPGDVIAGFVLQAITSTTVSQTIHRPAGRAAPDGIAEELWQFVVRGIGA